MRAVKDLETTKIVTGAEILAALEKNGFLHERGWYDITFIDKVETITSACVMGQAAINLGVSMSDIEHVLDTEADGLAGTMIHYNDSQTESGNYRSYSDLKKIARRRFKPYLTQKFEMHEAKYVAKRKSE